MYIQTYAFTGIRKCVYKYICAYTCIHVYAYTHSNKAAQTCHILYINVCMNIYVYIHKRIYTYIYIYTLKPGCANLPYLLYSFLSIYALSMLLSRTSLIFKYSKIITHIYASSYRCKYEYLYVCVHTQRGLHELSIPLIDVSLLMFRYSNTFILIQTPKYICKYEYLHIYVHTQRGLHELSISLKLILEHLRAIAVSLSDTVDAQIFK